MLGKLALMGLILALGTSAAQAQYPDKPVKIVVPVAAGGGIDVTKRSALLPDMATMDESGLPGFAVGNWAGLLGPAGLDPKIVAKLNSEIIAILGAPDVKERVKAQAST
jgi:tripartite-type tricarboxylate transporter receptor subunit TctC